MCESSQYLRASQIIIVVSSTPNSFFPEKFQVGLFRDSQTIIMFATAKTPKHFQADLSPTALLPADSSACVSQTLSVLF